MQAVEQPKKSKLWALLSGILGISWGLLFVVVPFCFLPQTFWGVMFILFFSFTPNVKEFAEVLQGAYTALAIISIVVWILLIISIYAKRYYRATVWFLAGFRLCLLLLASLESFQPFLII